MLLRYLRALKQGLLSLAPARWRGALRFAPGSYYSPLLDASTILSNNSTILFDGDDLWEHVQFNLAAQRDYYEDILHRFPLLPFPRHKAHDYSYYWENEFFVLADAFTLSGVIRRERPRRIIEVGSGFSSAVMLDTSRHMGGGIEFTCIEPFPARLHSLLSSTQRADLDIMSVRVQEVPLTRFDELEAQDILFIDSSHVAKVASDVTFLLLRVLPRLKPGVLIHFHDIFYPFSYPVEWIREGRAWNESIFLRAFLLGNYNFEIVAFNSFAGHAFPAMFRDVFPSFLDNTGGSIWLRKTQGRVQANTERR
jgi:hypothetical protein